MDEARRVELLAKTGLGRHVLASDPARFAWDADKHPRGDGGRFGEGGGGGKDDKGGGKKDGKDDADSVVAGIARKHLQLGTLEEKKSDREDFREQHVAGIKEALQEAHKAGSGGKEASDEALEGLAKKHLGVGTLKEREREPQDEAAAEGGGHG
jgi:hypothetical protein